MRIRSLATSIVLAAGLLVAPGAVSAASAGVQVSAPSGVATAAAACKYRRVGDTWHCVTPGAFCPKAARGKYGYAKGTNRRYKCVRYSNGRWRWKRV